MLDKLVLRSALMLALAAPAFAWAGEGNVVATADVAGSPALVDQSQMTLYTFDKDADGQSNCYDACAEKWPPLAAAEGAELPDGFSLVARKDGSQQVAYHGQPLYLWVKDKAPGDATGDGVKGVWHVARP